MTQNSSFAPYITRLIMRLHAPPREIPKEFAISWFVRFLICHGDRSEWETK
jgi:hypothetical protein